MTSHVLRAVTIVEGTILVALLLVFLNFADWNYRSRDGFLGRTMPPWQREIIAGTAPAPYVYRQGVPRVRRGLGVVLKPGHAAVLVDLVFAALALGAGLALGQYALGREQRWTGVLAALLAAVSVYPSDKPEAVAMVALGMAAVTLALYGRHRVAAIVCAVVAPFRPELPVLFGLSFLVGLVRSGGGRRDHDAAIGYATAAAIGVAYLVLSRFFLWPDARYPDGVPMVMLRDNLARPERYPGCSSAC